MISEPAQNEGGLVALYAQRMQHRSQMVATRPRYGRPAPSVHQFGRRTGRRQRHLPRGVTVGALVATALVVGTQAASAATTHQVQPGETLGGIANYYHVSVQQLAKLNEIPNPNLIQTGSTLVVDPGAQSSAPSAPATTPAEDRHHQVVKGETLGEIASQFGVTVEAIADANHLADINLIEVGTNLVIPSVGSSATQPATVPAGNGSPALHLIAKGETLGEIATHYGVSLNALTKANGITDPNRIEAGEMLSIPGAAPLQQDGVTKLRGVPVLRQSLPLSCEMAATSIATAYWGNQISEWVFIENMPYNPNPHLGFRGSMTGAFGGTTNYGVYSEPFVPILANYGFVGDAFYADGNADMLKQQIDAGHPVVVWITNMASVQQRSYATVDGNRFALVPQEHAVVAYGYDDHQVYISDPGDGAYRQIPWGDFMRSWGYFDGMSLAVYPKT